MVIFILNFEYSLNFALLEINLAYFKLTQVAIAIRWLSFALLRLSHAWFSVVWLSWA